MIDEHFVLLGTALSLYGGSRYWLSTLRGQTKPNRVTWFLWAVIPAIALSAQLSQGVRWQAVITFTAGFNPTVILLASFVNQKSYWKITRLDVACGLIALLAIVLWRLSGNGNLAILLSILADFLGGIPTLIKAYKWPETENHQLFVFGAANAVITLLTIKHWRLSEYGFALYVLLTCLVLVFLICFRVKWQSDLRPQPDSK